jgi:hypothetical protein
VKVSKIRRKQLNGMRALSDIPWPARKYRITPTLSDPNIAKQILVGQCSRKVAEGEITEGKFFKRKKTVDVPCGGNVYVKRGAHGKRRVFCEACRDRRAQRKLAARMQKRVNRISPRQQVAEQRKEVSRLRRLTRRGA